MRTALVAAAAATVLTLSACGSDAPEVQDADPPAAETESDEPSEAETEAATPEATEEPSNTASEPEEEESDDSGSGELALGASAEVGSYTVTVTDVQLDANDAIKEANSFNEDPEGRYVLVELAVTYTGDDEGDPWLDLSVALMGSDARIYDSSSCEAVSPNPVFDVPTLTSGGQATFDLCFDVPEEALDNPKISVEESLSFEDTKAVWRTDERAPDSGDAAPDDEPGDSPAVPGTEDALRLGESADVGNYSVTVTGVNLDANDAVQQANPFNDAPEGQYVLVSLDVTYTGDEEGDPWLDLSVELAGSDARIYDSSSCSAVTENPVFDLPTLATGGQATFDLCFDVPQDAVESPIVFVEETLSFDDARAAWLTSE